MLAVALLEVNAAVLLIVLVVFVAHELTVYWDLHYTTALRLVGPFEQMVHSFLKILPLLSLALLARPTAYRQAAVLKLQKQTQHPEALHSHNRAQHPKRLSPESRARLPKRKSQEPGGASRSPVPFV